MPTFHLFMLEVKCFTFHWRRQNRVVFMLLFYTVMEMYLALFRGNFTFISIVFLSMKLMQ
uniref:Macaca fascicularis brain cDNA clone: QflA-22210, similar to human ubiquitin specific protease 46 (USP46), mRNA, RefSeq: NM_022832.2 n=1 Tax=Macaca fascicularis TaxID=9541 RepID=I7GIS2_MACFA|nr:unnamed protein product [Macaca fascicularis]